jgi:xylitol oxidase
MTYAEPSPQARTNWSGNLQFHDAEPCAGQLAIPFTWKREWPAVKALLPRIEARSLFPIPPARIQSQYPRLADFQALVRRFDPEGKFHSAFLATNLLGA